MKKTQAREGKATKLELRTYFKAGQPMKCGQILSEAQIKKASKGRTLFVKLGLPTQTRDTLTIDRVVGVVEKLTILKDKSISLSCIINHEPTVARLRSGELQVTLTGQAAMYKNGKVRNYVLTCVSLIPKKGKI